MLRNPVDRAISAYHFAVQAYHETRPIEQAIAGNFRGLEVEEPLSAHDDVNGALRDSTTIFPRSLRGGLARWYRWYDREQVLVVETDEISRKGGAGFERVLEFLGLDQWRPPAFHEHNVGTYARHRVPTRRVRLGTSSRTTSGCGA